MKFSAIHLLTVILLTTGCTNIISAQSRIDKITEQLEKIDTVKKSIVSRRNPQTGKLEKKIQSFSFKDPVLTKKLIEAFEAEESNAHKSAISKDKDTVSYAFTFYNKTNMSLMYCLSIYEHQTDLSIIWKPE